jgi:hypothetical protein
VERFSAGVLQGSAARAPALAFVWELSSPGARAIWTAWGFEAWAFEVVR